MAHEGGYYRFFAYLNLFMFFMLILVLGANFLLLFVGWEGVGLCSYLLIGFYFLEKFATDAGNKAFIVNRIGDFGFSLAIFLIVDPLRLARFRNRVRAECKGMPVEASAGIAHRDLAAAAGRRHRQIGADSAVRLAAGRHGRPDAGQRPDPRRDHGHRGRLHGRAQLADLPAFALARWKSSRSSDWRRRSSPRPSAWRRTTSRRSSRTRPFRSSANVPGLGVGAFSAGIFHVMTHAFFKALLFLGAGSVIHACSGEQDMRKMGGLRKYTPITLCDAAVRAASRSPAFPVLSGYHSKDAILEAAYEHAPWMYWVGVFTAGMTAFYVFRAFFLTFFGEYNGKPARTMPRPRPRRSWPRCTATPTNRPPSMWIPLAILAVLSLVGGFINIPQCLEPMFPLQEGEPGIAGLRIRLRSPPGFVGIALAYLFYVISPGASRSRWRARSARPTRWIYNKYFVDEFYDSTVVEPMVDGSRTLLWRVVDVAVIDGIVNGIGKTARGIGGILRAAAVRLHPQLRGLGGAGLDPGHRLHRIHGRRRDDTARHRPVPAADRLPAAAAAAQEQSEPRAWPRWSSRW